MNETADPIDTEEMVIVALSRGAAVRSVRYKTSSIEEAMSFYRQMLMQPDVRVISTRKGER